MGGIGLQLTSLLLSTFFCTDIRFKVLIDAATDGFSFNDTGNRFIFVFHRWQLARYKYFLLMQDTSNFGGNVS